MLHTQPLPLPSPPPAQVLDGLVTLDVFSQQVMPPKDVGCHALQRLLT